MGEVINLRSYRKQKARAAKEEAASENRTRAGRTKAERERDEREVQSTVAFLDGRQIDSGNDEEAS